MKRFSFDLVIQEGRRGGAVVEIPLNVREVFGTGGQVKVQATFDGHLYRGSLAPMGGPHHVLGVTRELRAAMGKDVGDRVRVEFWQDTEPRVVEAPGDLRVALEGSPALEAAFEKLSYTHRKEFVQWIEEAKKPETRARRVAGTLEMLEKGKTR